MLDRVDEEQAEHLDAQGCEALFLFQVLVDRAAQHQALQRVRIHIAHRLAGLQKCFAAGQLHFQKLVVAGGADLANPAIGVDGAFGQFLQVVAVLNDHFFAADLLALQYVNFNARCDRPFAVARRNEADIGLVVAALDFQRSDLDLLDQLTLIGVHGIEAKHHMVLVHMGRRVAERAQRVHLAQRVLARAGQAAIDALRFVDDQNWPRRADQIDRPLTAGLLAVLIEVVDVLLVDGADGHDHDLNVRAGREIAHLAELR